MPQAETCGSVDDGGVVGIAGCTPASPGKYFRSAGKMIPGHAAIERGAARGNWNYVKRDAREWREGRDPKFEVPGSTFKKTSNFGPRTPACLALHAPRSVNAGGLFQHPARAILIPYRAPARAYAAFAARHAQWLFVRYLPIRDTRCTPSHRSKTRCRWISYSPVQPRF